MKTSLSLSSLCAGLALCAGTAWAAPSIGQAAPAFSATDTQGKTVSLADFKGRTVVLEWVNPGCPFVVKHYGSGNMPKTQKDATARGVVWLTVNSTSRQASDYRSPAELQAWMQQQGAAPTATLMDADGRIGRAYGARTTPHLYVIDARGTLAYAGAIDDKPSSNPADIPGATNHVARALGELLAGQPVSTPSTRAYGCSIKYADG